MLGLLWLIPALPLLAFLVIVAFVRKPSRVASSIAISAIAGSFLISLATLIEGLREHARTVAEQAAKQGEVKVWHIEQAWEWFSVGAARIEIATFVDPLGAIMLTVVTFVSLLVQIYSTGYMIEHGQMDPGYSRFYAYISLFTFSMLGLVLSNNFVQLFVFWELVGLCSFLLVGFWYFKPEAAEAAKKAFITTRFGDLGFLIGILLIFAFTSTFNFAEVNEAVNNEAIPMVALTIIMILLFCGAIGKSAQFPLHVWLPDAMEGPTPVSALIHAATMVAAGVFMVARLFTMFEASPTAMSVVAWIGGFTAIFAASQGLVMRDIKRVLAYSTISQLGYMMLALGLGGIGAGIFHLTTHAFLKALLFLGSGSVIHGSGGQDMFRLGGLGKKMPITRTTFLIGALALAGVPPLAGFWSKDEILLEALKSGQTALLVIGIITAFMTSFYIFRAYFLTFSGASRPDWVDPDETHGADAPRFAINVATADVVASKVYEPHAYHGVTHGPESEDTRHDHAQAAAGHSIQVAETHAVAGHGNGIEHSEATQHSTGADHAHESPPAMTAPLVILSVFAIFIGFAGAPFFGNPFVSFLTGESYAAAVNLPLAGGTTLLALLGIFTAWKMYGQPEFKREPLTEFGGLYTLLARRYYLDELYNWLIGIFILAVATGLAWFDRRIVDGAVNLIGWIVNQIGRGLNGLQTGRVPNYALAAFGGIAIIVFVLLSSPVGR